MSTAVFHRRRVERFAQLLEEAGGGRRHHSRSPADRELAESVRLTQALSGAAEGVDVDPIFRTGLRAMLMATIEREGIGETAAVRGHRSPSAGVRRAPTRREGLVRPVRLALIWLPSRRARGAIVVGLAAGSLALSGMSAASTNAMPGDALYTVKRSTEDARLALAGSDISRGQLYLEFAKNRLTEARVVRGEPDSLIAVLADMDQETTQGVKLLTSAAVTKHDATALDPIDAFVRSQRPSLSGLLTAQAGTVRGRTLQSVTLLDRVSERSFALREGLHCLGTVTASDALGPLLPGCSPVGDTKKEVPGGTGESAGGTRTGRNLAPPPTPTAVPGTGTPPGTPSASPLTPAISPSGAVGGLLDHVRRLLGGLL